MTQNSIVSALTFIYIIYFELISVYNVRRGSNFVVLYVDVQLSEQNLWEGAMFPY